MGTEEPSNALNHARYSDNEAVAAVNAAGYITSESDPAFTASAASNVAAAQITSWDTAASWGDHGAVGYLTSESDPAFTASAVSGVTSAQVANWDTAATWASAAAPKEAGWDAASAWVAGYEEGAWLPTGSTTYAISNGWYVKIGKMVFFHATIRVDAPNGNTNAAEISLPFPSEAGYVGGAYLTYRNGSGAYPPVTLRIDGGSSVLEIFGTNGLEVDNNFLEATGMWEMNGHYKAASF